MPEPDDPTFIVGPDELTGSRRRAERVRAAVAELPQGQSEVIRIAYFEAKPLSEVAQGLGIPLGTAKSRVRLAMRRLRHALAAEDAA